MRRDLRVITILGYAVWPNTSLRNKLWCKYRYLCVNGSLVEHERKCKSKKGKSKHEDSKAFFSSCVRSSVNPAHRRKVEPLVGLLKTGLSAATYRHKYQKNNY